ncbi:MAG: FAD-dependent oxidoreductase [Deltaproteobacteria bacterium]|nr:FAD-dependent oxidoreductase [Deltaproteobacteria bacterium]
MSGYEYDLGILGGGAAGLTAAAGAAQFGARTILIEKSSRLGGDCLHFGCIPSKTLIRTAKVASLIRRSREFGLPEASLGSVDLGAVMDRVKSVIGKIQEHDSPQRFCTLGAEIAFGEASFADAHSVDLQGRRISAARWIIATGSAPALPPVDGLGSVPCLTNETLFDERRLPGKLIVLGGGPVGLELAQAMGRLGAAVTVVEAADQILGPEDADMAAIIRRRLEQEGITILTSTRAVRAASDGGQIHLTTGDAAGGGIRVITADALLAAAGRRPNTEGLGLANAGVVHTARGIPVDARTRTNIPHIYACGDVNGQFPFTHVAGYEAGVALANAVLHLPRRVDYGKIGWCTYTDPEIASIGFNEKRAQKEGIPYRVWEESFADNDRAMAEGETEGKIKLLVSPAGKMLGCQIIGAHAGELIHEWVLSLSGGVKLSTLAGAVHIYPTLAEISKRVSGKPFAEKIFSDRTRSVLKFIFSLKGRACSEE